MRFLAILTSVFISVNLAACGSAAQEGGNQDQIAKNVDATEFHQLFEEKGGQMLDVRTDGEVAQGYIPGAVQMDYYSDDFSEQVAELDKNKPVFVYCAAGGRSGQAMNKMKDMGFKEVYNLSGGFPTWASAGYEVTK